jgi:hypothetical protein
MLQGWRHKVVTILLYHDCIGLVGTTLQQVWYHQWQLLNFNVIDLHIPHWSTRVKISQLVNRMCSHCLFPVVDKSGTSCYHLVTRLMKPTDSQQVVPTSLISSARNKLLTSWWQQARSNLLRTACISLVATTCSKSVTVINLVTRW